jgi:opacity protein-like surface antigen
MIAKSSALFLGVMIAAASFAPAQAADLNGGRGGSIKDDGMPTLMAQSAARFYIRADGSYAHYDRPQIDIDGTYDLFNTKIDGNWSAGGGIGYYISKNWRADFTLEQRFNTDVTGSYQATGFNADMKFGMKSTLGLFNVYYDFDTRSRFTPYVGAGLGWVDHKTSTGSIIDSCGCMSTIESGSNTSAAAALMAGVAVNLTGRGPAAGTSDGYGGGEVARNLYLDLGYRFLYLGEAKTGAINAVLAPAAAPVLVANDPTVSEIHAHEFRVGLRYDFR